MSRFGAKLQPIMAHRSVDDSSVGDEAADGSSRALTRTMFVQYAGASGDFNPMHHDDTIATQVGNPSVFGHGMLTDGLMARVVKDWFGPEAMRRLQVRFSKQVWPGDVLTCTAVVTGKREEGGEQARRPRRHRREPERRSRRSPARPPPPSEPDAMGLLDGRVAVVTGSGRGIGREFALCFGARGRQASSSTTSACRLDGQGTDDDPAAQVCKEIEALGGEAVPNYDSVTDFDGAAQHRRRPRSTRSARSTSS